MSDSIQDMSDTILDMSEAVPALTHVLENILKLDPHSKAGLLHFGVNNMDDLMLIDPFQDLKGEYTITTEDDEDITHHISNVILRKIDSLQAWYSLQQQEVYHEIDWSNLDHETFRRHYLSITVVRKEFEADHHTSTTFTLPKPEPLPSNRELESFQRSIKRSPADYNKFKVDLIAVVRGKELQVTNRKMPFWPSNYYKK